MADPITCVLLATYTNQDGDRMEYVLPEMPEAEVDLIEAYLNDSYPGGDVIVSVVRVETLGQFRESQGEDFDEFAADYWNR